MGHVALCDASCPYNVRSCTVASKRVEKETTDRSPPNLPATWAWLLHEDHMSLTILSKRAQGQASISCMMTDIWSAHALHTGPIGLAPSLSNKVPWDPAAHPPHGTFMPAGKCPWLAQRPSGRCFASYPSCQAIGACRAHVRLKQPACQHGPMPLVVPACHTCPWNVTVHDDDATAWTGRPPEVAGWFRLEEPPDVHHEAYRALC